MILFAQYNAMILFALYHAMVILELYYTMIILVQYHAMVILAQYYAMVILELYHAIVILALYPMQWLYLHYIPCNDYTCTISHAMIILAQYPMKWLYLHNIPYNGYTCTISCNSYTCTISHAMVILAQYPTMVILELYHAMVILELYHAIVILEQYPIKWLYLHHFINDIHYIIYYESSNTITFYIYLFYNMINNIFNNLFWILSKYIYLYIVSIPCTFIIVWFWLIYVDRLHLREKSRRLGINMNKYLSEYKYWKQIEIYLIYQMNAFSECSAGFTDGLLNKVSDIRIYETKDAIIQTDQLIMCDIEIQTDKIDEPLPIIITKEVTKEVIKEVFINKSDDIFDSNICEEKEIPFMFNVKDTYNIIKKPTILEDIESDRTSESSNTKRRIRIKRKNVENKMI